MRHRLHRSRLNRTSAHRVATLRNLCKAMIEHKSITTTIPKAKELRRDIEKLVTMAKEDTVTARRLVKARLGNLPFNTLSPKEKRGAKTSGDTSCYNIHRSLLKILFEEIAPKFKERQGGYTRIVKAAPRVGDAAQLCVISFVE